MASLLLYRCTRLRKGVGFLSAANGGFICRNLWSRDPDRGHCCGRRAQQRVSVVCTLAGDDSPEDKSNLESRRPSSFYSDELAEIEREMDGREKRREEVADDDEIEDEKSLAADELGWREEEETDLMEELDGELEQLAKDLDYGSPEEMLDALSLPPPETPRDVLMMPDGTDEIGDNDDVPAYKKWKPDDRMSNERTAVYIEKPVDIDGTVVRGFGRGSSKIGVPTANIEAAVLGVTVAALENGVYFGWARVGSRRRIHGAVVNIGYNPTFDDVKARVVEAHLLSDFAQPFYNQRIRLVLVGFLRKERKFDSFAELVRNIKNDIVTAVMMLKKTHTTQYRKHPIFDDGDR